MSRSSSSRPPVKEHGRTPWQQGPGRWHCPACPETRPQRCGRLLDQGRRGQAHGWLPTRSQDRNKAVDSSIEPTTWKLAGGSVASLAAFCRSASTISATSSSQGVVGATQACSRALVGSPSRVSTLPRSGNSGVDGAPLAPLSAQVLRFSPSPHRRSRDAPYQSRAPGAQSSMKRARLSWRPWRSRILRGVLLTASATASTHVNRRAWPSRGSEFEVAQNRHDRAAADPRPATACLAGHEVFATRGLSVLNRMPLAGITLRRPRVIHRIQ